MTKPITHLSALLVNPGDTFSWNKGPEVHRVFCKSTPDLEDKCSSEIEKVTCSHCLDIYLKYLDVRANLDLFYDRAKDSLAS